MSKKVYGVDVHCKNEIGVLTSLVDLYATYISLKNGTKKLRVRCCELLAYYLRYGYNKTTKEMAKAGLGLLEGNINVMNSELNASGFLVKNPNNHHVKFINPDLKALQKIFLEDSSDEYFFLFKIHNSITKS